MELYLLLILSLFISSVLYLLLLNLKASKLPPGPPAFPVIGNLLWLRHSFSEIESLLRGLTKKHGPIVTLHIGPLPAIFISDRALAHKALVEHGAAFSDRPAPVPSMRFMNSNQHNISSASYGPLWRLLRRNLTSEILQSSRVKLYADGRDWVLGVLINHLHAQSKSSDNGGVVAKDSFQFAMFCLLVLMCFGEKLDEKGIREIEVAQRDLLLYARYLNVFEFVPRISKYLFWNRWKKALELRQKQMEACLPLIKARREHKKLQKETEERFVFSYVDSILDIKLPEEGGRNLTEDEMLTLCNEFLVGGTDTTSTALQWIMAELVKNQEMQKNLIEEIESVTKEKVKEEDLQKMPYLKAVVLEGLRRHPPGHFVLPHAVTQDIKFEGYVIPKKAVINFMVAEMSTDEKIWSDPMEFRPERFLAGGEAEEVDITGSREIKMMPFGVGRRICPGIGLAILHLEYFVANLVREFEWKTVEGEVLDLSGKQEFTLVMKYPLRARLIPRRN
ncbi:cytochrome P450 89A2-like isoform X2 [Asparagus officinalis]|uniref:cytochrome P450 89A2-like isoform X1 n=1 Tax=Asparagus officinalis TaxID=4686 RepID=UPI00098E4FE7|nr:cytochrome P450 89A2-like isoform X1 [Asparagus officinalis]XP_020240693.1 cytochrome P450 89A2-like isoform X2 [Asparagus officinalis]